MLLIFFFPLLYPLTLNDTTFYMLDIIHAFHTPTMGHNKNKKDKMSGNDIKLDLKALPDHRFNFMKC